MKVRTTTVADSRRTASYYDNLNIEELKILESAVSINSMDGNYEAIVQYHRGNMYAPTIERKEGLNREVKHLLYCLKNGTHSKTDDLAGLRVAQILAAAHEPIRQNGQRIEFSKNDYKPPLIMKASTLS
jgi:hypothetical protein